VATDSFWLPVALSDVGGPHGQPAADRSLAVDEVEVFLAELLDVDALGQLLGVTQLDDFRGLQILFHDGLLGWQ
jgi:hypothetical protein